MALTVQEIPQRDAEGVVLVEVRGAIHVQAAQELDAWLTDHMARAPRHVALDLAGVPYVNSTGLGVLVKHAQALEARGGAMSLLGVTPKVMVVLGMLGLEHVFACVCKLRPQALRSAA